MRCCGLLFEEAYDLLLISHSFKTLINMATQVVAFTKGLLSTQQTDNSPADQSSVASASEADQQDLRPRQKRIERDSRAEGLEEKRVSNMRMKRDLVQLKHDTYREGMQALVEGELEPFTADDLRILL